MENFIKKKDFIKHVLTFLSFLLHTCMYMRALFFILKVVIHVHIHIHVQRTTTSVVNRPIRAEYIGIVEFVFLLDTYIV